MSPFWQLVPFLLRFQLSLELDEENRRLLRCSPVGTGAATFTEEFEAESLIRDYSLDSHTPPFPTQISTIQAKQMEYPAILKRGQMKWWCPTGTYSVEGGGS